MQNPIIATKTKLTNLQKYGVEVSSKAECVKKKAIETNMIIYGKPHHIIPEIIEKAKNTNIRTYGVPYVFQSEAIKDKIRNTHLKKYGVPHNMLVPKIKEKKHKTCLIKYGTTHHLKNKRILEKQVKTNMLRYGVPNVNQSSKIQSKSQKSGLCYKSYTTPNGEIRKVQGYEPRALDILFKVMKFSESEIITDRGKVPRIAYTSNEKSHYYFPDIYIPSENKIIEVKSTWTYSLHQQINCLKWKASIDAGFTCEFWVFTRTGYSILKEL